MVAATSVAMQDAKQSRMPATPPRGLIKGPLCLALVTHAVANRQSPQIHMHMNMCICAFSRRACSVHAHISCKAAVQL